jgi:hypothetical protein
MLNVFFKIFLIHNISIHFISVHREWILSFFTKNLIQINLVLSMKDSISAAARYSGELLAIKFLS